MKKRLFLPLLILGIIMTILSVIFAEGLEQPTLPSNQTEESVIEYNQQVDEYKIMPQMSNTIKKQKNIIKQQNEEVIEDNTTPLSVMSGHWALINLIITILSIIFTIILVIFCIYEKTDKDKPKEERKITKRCIFSKIINLLFSIILIVLFILTQDMSLPMELTDEFTIITLIIFILQLIVFVAVETIGEKKEERVDE